MKTELKKVNTIKPGENLAFIVGGLQDLPKNLLEKEEKAFLKHQHTELKKELVVINRVTTSLYICFYSPEEKYPGATLEALRIKGDKVVRKLNAVGATSLVVTAGRAMKSGVLAFCEGVILGNYQFLRYKSEPEDKTHRFRELMVCHQDVLPRDLELLSVVSEAVFHCRDLVNTPVIDLTAQDLAGIFHDLSREAGIAVEVFNKTRIEALKMGGLLAVNRGSIDPPTFTVMEYKPAEKINRKPFVLVGKGVVYDSGGISLKPNASMVDMKSDMAGAAAAALTIYAIAKAKLPVWIIGLMPATDNRPAMNAQVPGDVIRMYDGTTVEVLNTDAEGRLILADALAYAQKYKPQLVIDLATLTGAAQAAVGGYASVGMHAGAGKYMEQVKASGNQVCERIAEFPFWDDYKELIKSEVADIKNVGGPYAGAITAGKFLEHFTAYPYIHLDIAGPAFTDKRDSYRGQGGTGVGVRLLFNFFSVLTGKGRS